MATTDVQNDQEIVLVTEDDDITLMKDEIRNFSNIPPLKKNLVVNDFRLIFRL